MSIDLATRLSHLKVAGVGNLANVITAGSELSMTLTEASQLTVVLLDENGTIAGSQAVDDGRLVTWGGLEFTTCGFRHGPVNGIRHTTIVARDRGVQALKGRTGARSWANTSPTDVARAEALAVGLEFVGQPTGPRRSITRLGKAKGRDSTTSWQLLQRLAAESGFIVAAAAGILYFAAPSWLVKRPGWELSATGPYLTEYPDIGRTSDSDDAPGRGTLSILGEQPSGVLLPGQAVVLRDVPDRLQGRYLVDSCTINLAAATPGRVGITTPVDPKKQQVA